MRATCAIFCAVLMAAAHMSGPARADKSTGGRMMSAPEAYLAARSGKILLVDIRSRGEWRQTGVPAFGKRATIHGRDGLDGFLQRVLILTGGDKRKTVALICAAGVRSSRARAFLIKNGFTDVRDVSEGMEGHGVFAPPEKRGWLRRKLPVETCGACRYTVPATR